MMETRLTPRLSQAVAPPVGIGLWARHAIPPKSLAQQLHLLGPHHVDLLVDLRSPQEMENLDSQLSVCGQSHTELWLYLICSDRSPESELTALSKLLASHPETPIAGMLFTPAAYLKSYQPDGKWPSTITPHALRAMARKYWPDTPLGGGFPTYFTELNRCRPDPSKIDFLTHATSPIVHAADDHSVMETLESLPYIFDSARALAPGRLYRITTSAVGAWTNPYGQGLTPNPACERRTLSNNDPRQQALFAAAWSLGYMAQAAGRVDSLTLSSIGQPFPVTNDARHYPVFDVLRGMNQGAGHQALQAATCHPTLAAHGWLTPSGKRELWLANLSAKTATVHVDGVQEAAVLEEDIDAEGLHFDEWPLDRLKPHAHGPVTLSSYAIARLTLSDAITF